MAIYHLTAKTGSRSNGQSAAAKFDYIQREGKYSKDTDEVLHKASGNMPNWTNQPADYWTSADLHERVNGRLFKEIEFALPRELSINQQEILAIEFAQFLTAAEKLPYTLAIHSGKGSNPHCHLMISERINDDVSRTSDQWFKRCNGKDKRRGGAKKTVALKPQEWLENTRKTWANKANEALKNAKQKSRVDHRSLKDQGIDRLPQVHLGANVVAMEQKGKKTRRGSQHIERERRDYERNRQDQISQIKGRTSGRTGADSRQFGADSGRNISKDKRNGIAFKRRWRAFEPNTGPKGVSEGRQHQDAANWLVSRLSSYGVSGHVGSKLVGKLEQFFMARQRNREIEAREREVARRERTEQERRAELERVSDTVARDKRRKEGYSRRNTRVSLKRGPDREGMER